MKKISFASALLAVTILTLTSCTSFALARDFDNLPYPQQQNGYTYVAPPQQTPTEAPQSIVEAQTTTDTFLVEEEATEPSVMPMEEDTETIQETLQIEAEEALAEQTEEYAETIVEEEVEPLVEEETESPANGISIDGPIEAFTKEDRQRSAKVMGNDMPDWFVYISAVLILATLLSMCYIAKQRKESRWYRHRGE